MNKCFSTVRSGPSTSALFYLAYVVFVDGSGNIFIADTLTTALEK
jgi:hypothetical protein